MNTPNDLCILWWIPDADVTPKERRHLAAIARVLRDEGEDVSFRDVLLGSGDGQLSEFGRAQIDLNDFFDRVAATVMNPASNPTGSNDDDAAGLLAHVRECGMDRVELIEVALRFERKFGPIHLLHSVPIEVLRGRTEAEATHA